MKMNRLKKLRRNKKGFTLVEIIVVLLIVAILAAISIPTMLGYVDEAQNSEYIAKARTGYVAAQTVATKRKVAGDTDAQIQTYLTTAGNIGDLNDYIGETDVINSITAATVVDGKVTKITVVVEAGTNDKTVVIDTVEKSAEVQ